MSHRTTTTAWNSVQDGPGTRPPGSAPESARPASRILVASVEPFALWAHRWGRLDTVLAGSGAVPDPADAARDATAADVIPADAPLACSEDERTVAYADAAARAAGVEVGMTLAGARQRVPALIVLPAAGPEVDAAWEAFLDGMHEVAPRVAAVRTGVVAFDGDAHDAAAFAERTGARVGGAGTVEEAQLLAYTAEPGRARVAAPNEDPWAQLDPAPAYLLGGAGLSPAERERLAWLGVDTIGALRRWTPAQLRAYLGEEGGALARVLHGPRTDRLPRRLPPPVVTAEHAFEDAAREPAEIDPILERLVRRAVRALGERSAERVRVIASSAGLRSDATRRAKEPLRDPPRLLRLARLALEDAGLVPLGVEELRVELSGLARRAEAGELWPQRRRRVRAARAVHDRFPGQARRFALHDPDALRPRQRWRLLDLASGDPLPWDGPAPRDGAIGPARSTTAPAGSRPGRETADDVRDGNAVSRMRDTERIRR
jgi:protein ImuB